MIIDTFRKPVDYNKMKPQPAANQTQTNKPVQQVQVTPPVQFQIPQSAPYQQQYQQIPMQFQQQYQQVPMQVPMQLQQQIPMQYSQAPVMNFVAPYGDSYGGQPHVTLLGKDDQEYMKAKTAAIIVSIHNGQSYDGLFTSVKQKSQEGTKTMVFSATGSAVDLLIQGFEKKSQNETVKLLFKEMAALDPDCIVFNWECSSSYSGQTFPEGNDKVMKLVDYILKGKHMAMFSDFSLKALIASWNENILGPNPFRKMGQEFSETVHLRFDPNTLKESPSAQLQSVGDLSEGGLCNVHCLGGTIIYSIDAKKTDHNKYKLQVLTVAENAPVDTPAFLIHIKNFKGAAGHILLTYPNTGKILTSMGHWIELVKVDTSEQKLFEMAEKQYGANEAIRLQSQMANMSQPQKAQYIQSNAQAYVQMSAPCNNIAQKVAYNQYKKS